ncbi:MAG TPA: bifunctional riboflavin kinase/FAD synthetase [Bacteroidales bacterium]|nr:bifunctional riboflavin kinase/FAD synthetase [Bacteroidales bacterium]
MENIFYFCQNIFIFSILKVYNSIFDFPEGLRSVVSVGTFDGVHKGHQAIIKKMTGLAKENGLVSVILTFDPHPRYALKKDDDKLKLLSTTEEKIARLENFGIDYVVVINFTPEFAKIPYEEFIKKYLAEALNAKYVVVGFDHRFGENRSGNHQKLMDAKKEYGFEVVEIQALAEGNTSISSTKIRNLIENRQIEQANKLLNYSYSISGKVVEGTRTGKKLGFPTANMFVEERFKLIPATGVYAVKVEIDGKLHQGMCNIGFNPTFDERPFSIEAHIFDFEKDIYGKNIRIYFMSFIRMEQKFASVQLLKEQLENDKKNCMEKIRELS